MLALFAAALAASTPSPALEASVPWWERIIVTMDDKGKQQACQYEASLAPAAGAKSCSDEMAASVAGRGRGPAGQYAKITFERRFSPGGQLDSGRLQPGDELLGRQVMFLTINPDGSIESCRVVATSGDMSFRYDCDEARKEQFRVPASASSGARQAFMTVLAYAHSEQIA